MGKFYACTVTIRNPCTIFSDFPLTETKVIGQKKANLGPDLLITEASESFTFQRGELKTGRWMDAFLEDFYCNY